MCLICSRARAVWTVIGWKSQHHFVFSCVQRPLPRRRFIAGHVNVSAPRSRYIDANRLIGPGHTSGHPGRRAVSFINSKNLYTFCALFQDGLDIISHNYQVSTHSTLFNPPVPNHPTMSWWPFSGSEAKAQAQQTSSLPQATVQAQSTPAPAPPSSAPHDPDFYAAHPHLAPPSLPSNPVSQTSISSADPNDDLDPELPRTMSCRAAFDSAFYCSSLGGHFNDIYRYGQLRSCSEHWSDFWFCMRTKNSYSGADVKERIIQDRYREKERKLKEGPNCEDVWEKRKSGEEVRGAFAYRNDDAS